MPSYPCTQSARETPGAREIGSRICWLLVLGIIVLPAAAAAPNIEAVYPEPGTAIPERTPTIAFNVTGDFRPGDVRIVLNGFLEFGADDESFDIAGDAINWTVPEIFRLKNGMHNVTVIVRGADGTARLDWNFTVDPSVSTYGGAVDPLKVVLAVAGVFAAGVLGVAGYAVYLWQVKGYTWRKFLIKFPRVMRLSALYVPAVIAGAGTIGALVFVTVRQVDVRFVEEYIILGGIALAVLPFTIQTLQGRGRRRATERAFAQFLFEMADAMRGGIDPVKAVRELGAHGTGPLRKPLRIASESLQVGRPMDEVFTTFAKQTGSPLIARYTGLVTEAAAAGGDISMVVYQAAKDMDELTKIDAERVAAMRGPVATMYIAFGVLFMITTTLVDFAPNLADVDITSFASGSADAGDGESQGPVIDIPLMTQRFFHLLLIVSMGTGLLVGAFTEGNIRYGMHHMLLMAGLAGVGFPLAIL